MFAARYCFYTRLSFCPQGEGEYITASITGHMGRHPPGHTPPLPSACWDTPPPRQTPPYPVHAGIHPPADTMGYGQQVGGTHPTGMHCCLRLCFIGQGFDAKHISL